MELKQAFTLLPVVVLSLLLGGCSDGSVSIGSSTALAVVGDPVLLDTEDLGDVAEVKSVVDPAGNVMTVWLQGNGTQVNLWANYYTSGFGWGGAEIIDEGAGDVVQFDLVTDSSGNVTVVWAQLVEDSYLLPSLVLVNRTDLLSKRFSPGAGWSVVKSVETNDLTAVQTESIDDIKELALVVDGSGIVTVAWTQSNGTYYDLYANRATTLGFSWGTPELLDSEDLGDVSKIQLEERGSDIFFLWLQNDGDRENLWANRYSAGWNHAGDRKEIDAEDLGDVDGESAKLVIDASGNATVVWSQSNGIRSNIWGTRYVSGWLPATLLETEDLGNAGSVDLIGLNSGDAIAAWLQSDGVVVNAKARHFDLNGGGWQSITELDTHDDGDVLALRAIDDGLGNVLVCWEQESNAVTPVTNLWARRFNGVSWEAAARVDNLLSGDATLPELVVDGSNIVTALWLQNDDGIDALWSRRLNPVSGLWTLAEALNDSTLASASEPKVVVDTATGKVSTIWSQSMSSSYHLVGSDYSEGMGWSDLYKVEAQTQMNSTDYELMVDGNGNRIAVWLSPGNTYLDLWSNHY